jgi:Skp family chaperone for outer membrane proteins
MLRTRTCLVAALVVAATLSTASAQTAAPAAPAAITAPAAQKPSRVKLTIERLREMRAKWVQNRPKLKACRKELKSKGLTGDDRWFYMADCMSKG